ncbi:FKBP-type peptidyl-prolyl cis-trans isomerase [Hymenobacter rubidus]|uniref:FKBP-type peptidyl-prolyl cis-trans isomerase n=1 Tax=Hymenobacter rubidus TaxID=1441626 RepID=UPI00191FC3E9|nr:FKBP-type peptidyl-prolyl cis-trans isomerase [Hymenobacter rubidus]
MLTTAAHAQALSTPPVSAASPVLQVTTPDTTVRFVTQRSPRGVRFVFHERGTGAPARTGSHVAVRYTGFLPDGHVFDATRPSGGPLRFRVGRGEVIPGWDDLLPLLPAGSRVRAWVPAALAYGASGLRDPDDATRFLILPDTELVFELHVISVR